METKLSVQVQLSDTPIVSKKNRMRYARGRVYKTAEVQDFEHALEKAAAEAICQITDWKPLSGPVKLELQMQFPDRRRRDRPAGVGTVPRSAAGGSRRSGRWYSGTAVSNHGRRERDVPVRCSG